MISQRFASAVGLSAAVVMLSLAGCGSLGVALGMRMRLDKLPITAVSATLSPHPSLTPGKSGRLGSGVVSLPSDPRVSSGKTAHVHVAVVGHPGVVTDLDVPLQYNVAYAAHFSGASGNDGFDGTDGLADQRRLTVPRRKRWRRRPWRQRREGRTRWLRLIRAGVSYGVSASAVVRYCEHVLVVAAVSAIVPVIRMPRSDFYI
jgi:hypothetical protein